MSFRIRSSILLLVLGAAGSVAASVDASQTVIVAAEERACRAGLAMIQRGGNAVDAAVATAFTLAVTHPQAGNLGGGGFAVLRMADGTARALDFREVAPALATRDLFLDAHGEVVPDLSLESHLAAAVPGSVDGLLRLCQEHGSGRVPRAALLEAAIEYAENGFVIDADLASSLNTHRSRFERRAAARAQFVRGDGRVWRAGDLLRQPVLARTLRAIAERGRDGFYSGWVADSLALEIERGGGILRRADLAAYRSRFREPLQGSALGLDIVTMPLPSSGGVLLLHLLGLLERFDLRAIADRPADWAHLLTEVERRAYADRAVHFGDPAFHATPWAALLDPSYLDARAATISMERATPSVEVSPGEFIAESTETTHLSVLDAEGNAVSLTTTLNDAFGSAIVVAGAGFLLNNEMDDFSVRPGVPNLYGLVGGSANAIAPGKRPLSSMTPTIVRKGGAPRAVLGGRGGSRIITGVLQVLLNHEVLGLSPAEAVAAPRIHAQWLPDQISYEPGALSPPVMAELERRGHRLVPFPGGQLGQVNAIFVTDAGIVGAPDPRGSNAAVAR